MTMTEIPALSRAALVAAAIIASACGGSPGRGAREAPSRSSVAVGAGRPALSVVEREGDTLGAVSVAVTTEGIAPDRGAMVAVALGALVEERLAARGVADASVVGGWNGWRLRALVASPAAGARLVDATREAMLAPVVAQDPALLAVARRLTVLGRRALAERALVDVARCTGEAYGTGDEATPDATELEVWRRAAHGLGRIAIATAGDAALADAVAAALTRAPAWPRGAPIAPSAWPPPDARPVVYDASGEIPPGAARIVVTVRTTAPERAVAAAAALGDPRGPLASRLAALDPPTRVRSVVATAHVDGGCVAATVDLSPRDLVSDAPSRIATAAALARQELAVEVADVAAAPQLGRALATRASDPREAAERSAWWGLAGRRAGPDEVRTGLAVGVATTRDLEGTSATAPRRGQHLPDAVTGGGPDPPPRSGVRAMPLFADALVAEIDRATIAWHALVVEGRTRVERGQGEVWVLLASTCGTLLEGTRDAGTGAAVVTAAAMQAAADAGDARVEPFVSADGIGVLVHGPARAGESPQAHARRLADVAGRALAADALDADRVAQARTALLARAAEPEARALAALGGILAPSHASWVDPLGTSFGLGAASDAAIATRAAAIRASPFRVAVIANSDSAQADIAVRAVDRWVTRRPNEARSCPSLPTLAPARAGTYAVELPPKAASEAILAVPLAGADEAARFAAAGVAAALDGPGGLLARAVGGTLQGDLPSVPLARAWSAAVVGGPRSPALVLRLVASDSWLDAAVAQTRALLDRLRQGGLREEDRARAAATLGRTAVAALLDPRARAIGVWRDADHTPAGAGGVPPAPSLDALRVFASAALHDDALIIIALRPARGDAEHVSTVGR
jgi:hypothetical protein